MVHLEFIEINGDDVVYDYMPERIESERGTVSVNRKTRARKLIKAAPGDEISMYRGMAWKRIDQMLDEGTLEKKTGIAWY